ncbi:MAG: hypothetical protein J6X30_01935 [Clostridia bacterium]|nr:hypothetical protein [Clostridia bacterium]
MKKARLVLWALTPVFLLLNILLVYRKVQMPFWLADLLVALVLLLPVTAMLLRTLQNKDKNLNKNYFILKLVFIILLYTMVLYLFGMTMLLHR